MSDESNEFLSKILYPEDYNIDYIKTYYSLNSEFKQIIEKSGYKKEFARKYLKSLKFIVNLKKLYRAEFIIWKIKKCRNWFILY